MTTTVATERVNAAIKDRARYLACFCRSFATALPEAEVERLAREAIRDYGKIRAARDPAKFSPEDWVDTHLKQMGDIFSSEIDKTETQCEFRMHSCPLLDEWQEMGCTDREQDLFCDIAMELDRGRAEAHGFECEIPLRRGKGDSLCRVVLSRK